MIMRRRPLFFRRNLDRFMKVMSFLSVLLAVFFLFWILYTVLSRGMKVLSFTFLIESMKPYGIRAPAGVGNAIVGTFLITLGASVIAVPVGVLGGIYLSEFGRSSKLGDMIRFCANVMMGIPSIIVGLFVYTLVVMTMKTQSGFAGSLALAIIMFPVVLRTTEDMLCMVPNALREAGLALGTPRWRVTVQILFRAAKSGLITGILLSMARVCGETAPLLFTAGWSMYWPKSFFSQPTANLTVTITEYANNSPFPEMNARAWGASFLITAAVLILNISARTIFREAKK